jgi:hypothetical protein
VRAIALTILFCGVAVPVMAETNFSGYLKSYLVIQDEISNDLFQADTIYQSQNSGRFMVESFKDNVVFQLHYDVSPVFVSRAIGTDSPTFNVVGDSYRLSDLETSLTDDESHKNQLYQNLDRLNVQVQLAAGDLTIGRQAISFGAARLINPTDVFLPFDVQTFNTEYRTGVDAVRFQRPWGDLGEIDVGVVLGKDADQESSAAFVQIRKNFEGKDFNFALIEFAEQTLIGAGVQSELGDMGFWFEAAYVDGDVDYLRASTGLDYAFTENVFGMIEYHYNGAGSNDPDDYLGLFNTTPYQRGGVFLLGENYLMPSLSIQASPLLSIGLQAIVNLDDKSVFTSISAEYNIAENFYMDFGMYHFAGDDLTVTPFGLPVFRSEYGANPNSLYTSIRWYF